MGFRKAESRQLCGQIVHDFVQGPVLQVKIVVKWFSLIAVESQLLLAGKNTI
jgi:hypothetical protein